MRPLSVPLRVIKRHFGQVEVRYRRLKKKTARLTTLFALSNLRMARRSLLDASGMPASAGREMRRAEDDKPEASLRFSAKRAVIFEFNAECKQHASDRINKTLPRGVEK